MAVDACGIFPDIINVCQTIDIGDAAPVRGFNANGEGVRVKNAACIAARKHSLRAVMQRHGFRALGNIGFDRFRQGLVQPVELFRL